MKSYSSIANGCRRELITEKGISSIKGVYICIHTTPLLLKPTKTTDVKFKFIIYSLLIYAIKYT